MAVIEKCAAETRCPHTQAYESQNQDKVRTHIEMLTKWELRNRPE
jgi:hypothetical protein